MNVAQLMQILSNYPAETEILVEGYETGYDPVHSVTLKTVAGVVNPEDYDGLFDAPDNLAAEIIHTRRYGGSDPWCGRRPANASSVC